MAIEMDDMEDSKTEATVFLEKLIDAVGSGVAFSNAIQAASHRSLVLSAQNGNLPAKYLPAISKFCAEHGIEMDEDVFLTTAQRRRQTQQSNA